MAEDALNLTCHGERAETPGFTITIEKDLDAQARRAELFPQELTPVLVNMIGNGFYAVRKRAEWSKQHGGTIVVRSKVDSFTEFTIIVPRPALTSDSAQAT